MTSPLRACPSLVRLLTLAGLLFSPTLLSPPALAQATVAHDHTLCAANSHPVAEIVLPSQLVQPSSEFDVTLIGLADAKSVTISLAEQTPDFEVRKRAPLSKSVALTSIAEGERLTLSLPLPDRLLRPTDTQLRKAHADAIDAEPVLLTLEVAGELEGGPIAYSSTALTFVQESGAFRILTLPEYAATYPEKSGALYELPAEHLLSQPTGKKLAVEPEPVATGPLYLDASGNHIDARPSSPQRGSIVTANVYGTIHYTAWDGTSKPLGYAEVAVFEKDATTSHAPPDNILLTNENGYFQTTVVHDDGDNDLELYLRVKLNNTWVRVGNGHSYSSQNGCYSGNDYCGLDSSTNIYQWSGPEVTGVTGGSVQMNYTVAGTYRGGAQVFDWLMDAASLTNNSSFTPGQVRAVWNLPISGAASIPSFGQHLYFGSIHGLQRSEDVAYHEYGHFAMYRRNPYKNPNTGGPHSVCSQIHPAFAWSEGWATGFAQHVNRDGYYDAANFNGARAHIEDARLGVSGSCAYPTNNGSTHNEMWVAAAVNDFQDYGEPNGGDDLADRALLMAEEFEIIRTTDIDGIYEFYNAFVAAGILTQVERNRVARVMNLNHFPVNVPPPSYPPGASITGPTSLPAGQTGTWSASVSNMSGYTRAWEWRVQGGSGGGGCGSLICDAGPTYGVWHSGGTASTFSRSLLTSETGMDIRLTVQSGGTTVVDLHYVDNSSNLGQVSQNERAQGEESFSEASLWGEGALPDAFAIRGVYPNPSRGRAEIVVDVPEEAHVMIVVYDALGREVARPWNGVLSAGTHTTPYDGTRLPSGLYLVRYTAGEFSATRQMTVFK